MPLELAVLPLDWISVQVTSFTRTAIRRGRYYHPTPGKSRTAGQETLKAFPFALGSTL